MALRIIINTVRIFFIWHLSLIQYIMNFLAFYPFFEDNRRMNEELDALEIKVSYLELKCDELNEVIVEQQKDMKKMKAQIEALEKKVLDLEEESGQDRPNRKPPHY